MTWKLMPFPYRKQLTLLLIAVLSFSFSFAQNPIVTENSLPGNPQSEWDISGAGSSTLQGFATDISVNKGERVNFKINTSSVFTYTISIYRLGYYQGNGARLITTLPTVTGTVQPDPVSNSTTGIVDCGNWSVSAFWDVPASAVSGIYIAKLTSTGNSSISSHIVFIVRDDASTSDLFFQTSDATWQAYNNYGGNSLYVGATSLPNGHAAKVSYNRPFNTRAGGGGGGAMQDWLFSAEYPMIRFLERNGYNVSYTTNVDAARRGNLILNHKVFLSLGHDEYWSAEQRANVEAARDAGVHLAFFSGNEVYWKTRWENSVDGNNTSYRTLVCYKEGTLGENVCSNKCDPTSTWTGLWRDGGAWDGGKPENALTGQISWADGTSAITVPSDYKNLRFWRNTSVASLADGATETFPNGTLGFEWDFEQYTSNYPSGRITLSSTTVGGKTHKLSLYRHSGGALVFGAGTVQWSWGLDDVHDGGSDAPSVPMQQATVNLFADMGVQPATLQSGLTLATASTDFTAPVVNITSPANGATLPNNTAVTISGTASDADGVLVGVEISVDGGTTWQTVTGTTSWTYSWTPAVAGAATIKVRGFDDSGNMGVPGAPGSSSNINVTISGSGSSICPCTIFPPTVAPADPLSNDGQPIEVGVKFRTTQNGYITGIRFYKGAGTTGTHTGHLWSSTGTKLAEATFINESASGWQEVLFTTPVAITTGTTYIASYFSSSGDHVLTNPFFTQAVVNGPLRALANGEDGPNGVYIYSATSAFPTNNFETSNYWADVIFATNISSDVTAPTVFSVSPVNAAADVSVYTSIRGNFSEVIDASTVTNATFELRDAANTLVPAAISTADNQAILIPSSSLNYSSSYTATIKTGVKDLAGNALVNDYSWTFTTIANSGSTFTIFQPTVVPADPLSNDGQPIEVGVKFRTVQNGYISGIRFYKGAGSTGIHTGHLWSSTGTKLGEATFINESASGWQEVLFTTPVAITTGTTYIASYFSSSGDHIITNPFFTEAVINGPLRALANGEDGPNGVYIYSATSAFPVNNFETSNYWVDVVFNTSVGADVTAPTVFSVSPVNVAADVSVYTSIIGNFSEVIDATTVTNSTFELRDAANALIPAAISTANNQAILIPSSSLNYSSSYTATIKAGIKDLAGNALVNDYSWTFATAANSGSTFTIFQPTVVPADTLSNDGQPIEVGVKFRTIQNGYITGIRFYKVAGSTGIHTGHLWSSAGTMLAEATFINESASGWQEVLFTTPVAITTGTTYIASYFSSSGDHIVTNPFFTQAVVNGPLRALANGQDGPNGVYIYSATSAFPTNNFETSNYWADVVFNTSIGPVTTPPVVTTHPASQAICAGNNASFTSAASGTPAPTIQWQESTNGTTWANINGATNSTLTFVPTITDNNKQYRAVWTNSVSSVNSDPAILTVNAIPAIPTVTVANNCGSSVLTASGYTGTLLWSNGATTASIMVTNAATYTVTQTVNGCTSAIGSAASAPKAIPAAPTVTVVNNCGNSVLTASGYTGTLLWSNGATIASITVTNAATYTVTQTVNGCTSAAGSATSAPKAIPSVPTVMVVNNCSNSVLTASGCTGTLLWSNGAITESITVTTSGEYSLIQTVNGCVSEEGYGVVAPKAIPIAPIITVVDNCSNSVLTASGYTGTLLWSNGATTKSITVTNAATYTVTQTVNGCTGAAGSATSAPKAIPVTPIVTVVNNCGNSVLTASGYTGTLLWSNGTTTPSITVTNAATYTVTQTVNGCTSAAGSAASAPKAIPVAPIVTGVNNCGNSVLTASGYIGTLLWSNGTTTPSIMVTNAATYTLTQTVNGCTSAIGSAASAPKAIPAAPAVTVVNNCGNSVLTASGYTGTLLWSNGATTASIMVTNAATYTVRQTINGCTSAIGSAISAPKAIPAAPTVTVVNNCGSSVLTASVYTGTLLWSNGATTASITVTNAATYTVKQTVNGCTSAIRSATSAPGVISVPTVTVTNNCGNSVLTASGYTGTLLWSNRATTASITVTNAATYTVRQTVNGCTSAIRSATSAPKAIPAAPAVTVVNNCGNSVITASGYTGTLLWSNGATTASITVTNAATYTVRQTINGCTSATRSATSAPKALPAAPTISVSGATSFCQGGFATLTSSSATGNIWSTGATTRSILVNTSGSYTVRYTGTNGCSSPNSAARVITVNPAPVLSGNLTATVTSGTAFSYVPASATPGTTFTWSRVLTTGISNPASSGTGSINQILVNTTNAAVSVTYTYTLTANGCTKTQNVVVTVVPAPIVCSMTSSITANMNSSSIPAGRSVWLSSVFDPSNLGTTGAVNFYVTNSKITATVSGQPVTMTIPNSRIRFDANVTSATTQFINNVWETQVPLNYNGNIFMGGLSLVSPGIPGGITNVTWSATISSDRAGVSVTRKWATAVYTNFNSNAGLNIKAVDGSIQNPYTNNDKAGTPENYKQYVVSGGTGSGGTNYTGNYSIANTLTCTAGFFTKQSSVQTTDQIADKSAEANPLVGRWDVKIMPNPSTNYFTLVINGNNENLATVRILSIFGQVVERHEKVAPKTALRLGQALAGGTYFAEIIQGDQRKVVKIIKVN